MIHHTVTSGTSSTVSICERGYEGLPGPLCHGVIAKDGTVYLIGNGRANHAGRGDRDVLNAVIAERSLPSANAADADEPALLRLGVREPRPRPRSVAACPAGGDRAGCDRAVPGPRVECRERHRAQGMAARQDRSAWLHDELAR